MTEIVGGVGRLKVDVVPANGQELTDANTGAEHDVVAVRDLSAHGFVRGHRCRFPCSGRGAQLLNFGRGHRPNFLRLLFDSGGPKSRVCGEGVQAHRISDDPPPIENVPVLLSSARELHQYAQHLVRDVQRCIR